MTLYLSKIKLATLTLFTGVFTISMMTSGFMLLDSDDNPTPTDCIVCERIDLFKRCKNLINKTIWKGLSSNSKIMPLLYFTDSNTYIAFGYDEPVFSDYEYQLEECNSGLPLMKLTRMDTQPFHMENKMSFTDTASLYYYYPMMQCSDVETMNKFVPDFDKTEDWLQLVMHEYFHSFQFSHSATIDYMAETIRISADTLDRIYLQNKWFSLALEKENTTLLNAINCASSDSLDIYIDAFLQTRQQRRKDYENLNAFNLSTIENFWETIEGAARYVEYYLAGSFDQVTPGFPVRCDSLFKNFEDYAEQSNFEDKLQFRQRTKIMQAYYYVTGFNLCRLMDKMNINYKKNLFDNPADGLYEIFIKNTGR